MTRPRRTVIAFRTTTAPAFARCSCGSTLAGMRCWTWKEPDGTRRYGCRVCMFRDAKINNAMEAA